MPTVNVGAWCGHCGESFRLAELFEGGQSGRCPRCGQDLAPGYTAVASAATHQLIASVDALMSAAAQLHDVTPHLHVDQRRLAADLESELG